MSGLLPFLTGMALGAALAFGFGAWLMAGLDFVRAGRRDETR